MTNIYILQLINNKYYIGKTNNPQKRLLNHFQRQGSAWTKKYKPIRIEKVINNADDFDEDKWTIKYMKLYGIENVRGGSFCSIQLSESNKQTLQQMITGSGDCCYKCGQRGHFIQNCPFLEQSERIITTHAEYEAAFLTYTQNDFTDEEYEVWCCDFCNKEFNSLNGCTFHENRHCAKHPRHTVKYITNRYPCSQCNRLFDTKKGADYHKRFYCKKKTTSSYNRKKKNKYKSNSNSNTFYYNY